MYCSQHWCRPLVDKGTLPTGGSGGHGRAIANDIDLSRTIGWFTTIFPVLLTLEGFPARGGTEGQNSSGPESGHWLWSAALSERGHFSDRATANSQAERFNYLGQLDQVLSESALFEVDRTPARAAAHERRRYLLDISGFVLEVSSNWWMYSEQMHRRTSIEGLAQGFIKALRSLIHCQSPEAGGYTPSDFPAANLSQKTWSSFCRKSTKR